ncbi:phosphatidylglycerophosphatase A [bacterium BMS3Abin02]|nr:phosphatidylglycerophosphatase A [bacterium BMS3Abin02]HDL49318.1 phosphatidylglycerophosphatase A [Actinomycetota bacterium]
MHRLVASWFGSGLLLRRLRGSDAGSGTVASAVTLVVALLLHPFGWGVQLAAALTVTALALWSAGPFAEGDPGWVVVDEAAGMLWATIGLGGWAAVVAFVVFRIADITKRFPGVSEAERLHGALGVTADDVVAGLYGLAAGWVFFILLA